jgi:hypothetical protein
MDFNDLYLNYKEKVNSLKLIASKHLLLACVASQQILHLHKGKREKTYPMSSSKLAPSCNEGSLGTPWGLHEVSEKIGEGAEVGTVFEGRVSIGKTAEQCSLDKRNMNLITTRILRLRGLEEGVNKGGAKDTFKRYVYIHGTNHEDKIGKPASSGCLQMLNADIIELFDNIEIGTHLFISVPH